MPRWNATEREAILDVRERCKDYIAESPPYAEVVGDRKILRFLRGHNHNIEKATEMYCKFLDWRMENNVDVIRENIVQGGMNHPKKFPFGETILKLMPQIVCTTKAMDRFGSPICIEQYDFSPTAVLQEVPLEHHVIFAIYCLEYRSLVVEQLSEQRERMFLASLSPEQRAAALSEGTDQEGEFNLSAEQEPYGVLVNTCVIRDIGKLSYEHVKERELLKTIVVIASNNYPELLRKCFIVNSPFVFQGLWYFLRGVLAKTTVAKVAILGSEYSTELHKDIDPTCVPALVGPAYCANTFSGDEGFVWDLEILGVEESEGAAAAEAAMLSEDGLAHDAFTSVASDDQVHAVGSTRSAERRRSRQTLGGRRSRTSSARLSMSRLPTQAIMAPPPRGCCPRRRGTTAPPLPVSSTSGSVPSSISGVAPSRISVTVTAASLDHETLTTVSSPVHSASNDSQDSFKSSSTLQQRSSRPIELELVNRRTALGTDISDKMGEETEATPTHDSLGTVERGSFGSSTRRDTMSSSASWEEHQPVPCTIS